MACPIRRCRRPFRRTRSLDAPGRDFDGVPDAGLRSHDLGRKGLDHIGRQPGGTEAGGDVRRTDVLWLDFAQRSDVALVLPIQCRRCFGGSELRAHGTGQVGIRRLPGLGQGIAEDRGTELRERGIGFAVEKLGQVVGIDAAGLVEGDRKRVGCGGDQPAPPAAR